MKHKRSPMTIVAAECCVFYSLLSIYLFLSAQGTQFPRAVNIKKDMKHVWKGHGANSEIGNVSASARQAALNRLTATDKLIYLFKTSSAEQ